MLKPVLLPLFLGGSLLLAPTTYAQESQNATAPEDSAEAKDAPPDEVTADEPTVDEVPAPPKKLKRNIKIAPLVIKPSLGVLGKAELAKYAGMYNSRLKELETAVNKGVDEPLALIYLNTINQLGVTIGYMYPPAIEKTKNVFALFKGLVSTSEFKYYGVTFAKSSSLSLVVPADEIDISTLDGYTIVSFEMGCGEGGSYTPNMFINHTYLITTDGRQIESLGTSDLFRHYDDLKDSGGLDAFSYPSSVFGGGKSSYKLVFPGTVTRYEIGKIIYSEWGRSLIDVNFWENM